jgi:hypothetical protein
VNSGAGSAVKSKTAEPVTVPGPFASENSAMV